MPSHIFIRLGLWQESIDSNRASAAAPRSMDQRRSLEARIKSCTPWITWRTHTCKAPRTSTAKRVFDDTESAWESRTGRLDHGLRSLPLSRPAMRSNGARWAEAASLTLQPNEFPWSRFRQAEASGISPVPLVPPAAAIPPRQKGS